MCLRTQVPKGLAFMSQAVRTSRSLFWTSPALASLTAGKCADCDTEFLASSFFCHACGASRARSNPSPVAVLTRHLELFRALEFQNIQRKIGLPLPALISFFAGVGCVLATLLVGVIYSARNFADFQAIQLWRMEWLLGAVAAFVAGILLKKPSPDAQAPAASNPTGDIRQNRP
ncbi:MAG: hypothetical protein QOD84_664, partial [Acidobacteriaceae bacterium]